MDEGLSKKLGSALIKAARVPLRLMPLWMEAMGAGVFISTVVEKNPAFGEKLCGIGDKVFYFEARDLGKGFYMHIKDGSVRVIPHMARTPDVTMSGNLDVLAGVLLGRIDPDTVFFSRRLEITGDTAAAIHFKNTLAALG